MFFFGFSRAAHRSEFFPPRVAGWKQRKPKALRSLTPQMPPSLCLGSPACRGWASEPQLQAILLNPWSLSPRPLKIQNNGWVEGREPTGSGEKVSGSVPSVLCKPNLVFMALRFATSVAWPPPWPAALAVLNLHSGPDARPRLVS